MARPKRTELFSPDEIAIVHVMNRVVRKCFLMGIDADSGIDYGYRRKFIEDNFRRYAGLFGMDLLAYAILSNHFHAVLRSRPDVVATWSDREVARRWRLICPLRRKKDGSVVEPTESELNKICNDRKLLKEIRSRLSNISWWMRLVSQRIAIVANREDKMKGKFWEARFNAVRILDETSLVGCAAYLDLNVLRAAMAETLETSKFTSVYRRIEAMTKDKAADCFLAPVRIDEMQDPTGPHPHTEGFRCSDKGFLNMTAADYLELLDWTARHVVLGKAGSTTHDAPPILERLSLDVSQWGILVQNFGTLFSHAAGRPQAVDSFCNATGHRRFGMRPETRNMLAESA